MTATTAAYGPWFIYALMDPRDDSIRYIGRTNNVAKRLALHKSQKSNKLKRAWLTMLLSAGDRIVEEERLTREARAIRAHAEAIALSRLRAATADCGLREEQISISWPPPDHRGLQICRAEASFSRPMTARELPEHATRAW